MSDHDKNNVDEVTGIETTGHEWDGVKELNNPLPRWWLSIFYATIVFSIGYMIAYPAWPMLTDYTRGVLGYSSRDEVRQAIVDHRESQAVWRDRIAAADLETIRGDAELSGFAIQAGRAAFAVNCSQCHGSGAAGAEAQGYPNLNDDAWLWGGEIEEIHQTIAHGVRNASDESRYSEMPVFGEILEEPEIDAATQFVLSLGGLPHDAQLSAQGAVVFEDNCSSCHGSEGEGDPYQGAPRLADAIWLFGGDADSIANQIRQPRHGVMPAWSERLDDTTVKSLAVYVHALGGGQ
ncbi:MAG: cytochrome-c oxidase, cbb3-type subunit III [Pseudomonadota bacterium]